MTSPAYWPLKQSDKDECWQRNKGGVPDPLYTQHSLKRMLAAMCPCRIHASGTLLFRPMVTIIASYYHHRSHFSAWMYSRREPEMMWVLRLVMWALAGCCAWGMFSKIILWIIKRLKSDPPCRMPAGIGIISSPPARWEWPRTKGSRDRKEADTSCWMTADHTNTVMFSQTQGRSAKIRSHYFADYFLSVRVAEHTAFVISPRFRIMLCLLHAELQPWTRHECQWPISLVRLWWPRSFTKLREPDEISKNPNLSLHLDRAASWSGGL